MSIRKIEEIIKEATHPLEDHFDIEKGSTQVVIKRRKTELNEFELYDKKEKEIEEDFQEIADVAMDVVELLRDQIESGCEPKYLARLAEVAGQQLSVALSAVEKKAKLKEMREKLNQLKNNNKSGSTVNNNVFIMNRNEVLEAMMKEIENTNESDIIDVQVEQLTDESKEKKEEE